MTPIDRSLGWVYREHGWRGAIPELQHLEWRERLERRDRWSERVRLAVTLSVIAIASLAAAALHFLVALK